MRALCLFLCGGLCLAMAAERFNLEHAARIASLSNPQITPDGRTVVVAVSRADLKQNRFTMELIRIDTATRSRKVLLTKPAGQHRLSPDGTQLAYVAAADGKSQIFVMPLDGGELVQVSRAATGVESYAWRPDGKEFAYTSLEEETPRDDEEKANRSFEADVNYLAAQAPRSRHIWLVPATGGEAQRLTSGHWSAFGELIWSPRRDQLAFTYGPKPGSRYWPEWTSRLLDVTSGSVTEATGRKRLAQVTGFSPDGARIAYTWQRGNATSALRDLWISGPGGAPPRDLTGATDINIKRAHWMPDGRSLVLAGPKGTRTRVWIQPLEGRSRDLDLGELVRVDEMVVARSGVIALIGSTSRSPSGLYLVDTPESKPRRLIDLNATLEDMDLGKQENLRWKGPEGRDMDGVLTYPPGYDATHILPMVVLIHGGPHMSSGLGFQPRTQWLAAHGWIVFEPNYRGSDNLGNAHQNAIRNDACDGPGRDIMSGVDLLVRRKIADPARLAVSGWSYGGNLTVWLLGNYPDRWRAGVAFAAITDHVNQYALSVNRSYVAEAFGGSPFTDPQRLRLYRRQSPITYASKIKAPTLVLCDSGDVMVPVTSSYLLYHALRDNGVKTKFVVYPVGGHMPPDPVHQRDLDRRWAEWIKEHMQPQQ